MNKHSQRLHIARRLILPTILAALSACGGGGGGGDNPGATPQSLQPLTVSASNIGGEVTTLPTTLRLTVSNDPSAAIASTTWTYGDGQQGSSATHTYSQPGTYTYSVKVVDTLGRQATASGQVTVSLPAAPTVSVSTSADLAILQPVRFSVASALGAGTQLKTQSWDYGDGQTGSTASHSYTKVGSYTVALTVTDSLGRTATANQKIRVKSCSNAGLLASVESMLTTVCVQTSMGEMVFEIDGESAPISAANFMRYVEAKFYEGLVFHRVIKDFVAQAGGFTSNSQGELIARAPLYAPIVLESANGLSNVRYSLGMARTDVPNSATSQFYINSKDNLGLDHNPTAGGPNGYAVFGQVISGREVADRMNTVSTSGSVPVTPIVIYGMTTLTSP